VEQAIPHQADHILIGKTGLGLFDIEVAMRPLLDDVRKIL
jgi:hypothetical protein